MDTVIYFVKACDVISRSNLKFVENDGKLEGMTKGILSVKGEEQAKILSQQSIFKGIDAIYSSSHPATIGTAKYMATSNKTLIHIDSRLNERKIGLMDGIDVKEYHRKQAKDWNYKLVRGESLNESKQRIVSAVKNILMFETGNRVVVVSHPTLLTCLFSSWCQIGYNFDEEVILSYHEETIVDGHHDVPTILEVVFEGTNVKSLQIVEIQA